MDEIEKIDYTTGFIWTTDVKYMYLYKGKTYESELRINAKVSKERAIAYIKNKSPEIELLNKTVEIMAQEKWFYKINKAIILRNAEIRSEK